MSRFTLSAALPDEELEARIRATLRRHADDIEPTQPPWSELIAQAGAVVLPLHGTELSPAHLRSRRGPHLTGPWVRPVLAAAVALCLAMTGALIVQRTDGGEEPAAPASDGDEVPNGPTIPVPGGSYFRAAEATPFALSRETAGRFVGADPSALGEQYLVDHGLPDSGYDFVFAPPGPSEFTETPAGLVEWTTVWWSLWPRSATVDGQEIINQETGKVSNGAVYLRREPEGLWTIVGAYTQSGISVTNIRRADGVVSFEAINDIRGASLKVRLDGTEHFLEGNDPKPVFSDPAPDEVILLEVTAEAEGAQFAVTALALAAAGAPETTPSTTTAPMTMPGR